MAELAERVVQGQHPGVTVLHAIISDLNETKIILRTHNAPYGDCLLLVEPYHCPLELDVGQQDKLNHL